jgi:DNA polymerase-4
MARSAGACDNRAVRTILHVDLDAFFASVEQLDDPSLRGRPVLVGGPSRRGVVAAASYEARAFGVHSAMPMMQALERCPHAVVVPGRRDRYTELSGRVFDVFRRYTPLVEGLSIDEAFLDVTASRSLFGEGEAIARRVKDEVRGETGLTASAGVAPCKFVAKIASDLKKPDGLVVVSGDLAAFLAPLPVERMWGVGAKTAPKLRALGLRTLGDLARADAGMLERTLGSWGADVARLARGEDDRAVDPDGEAKSIGSESTYERDLTRRADVARTLLDHAEHVARRMVKEGLFARIVVVKLKYADFTLLTRRVTLPEPVADTQSIYRSAAALLERFPPGPVRLSGVAVAGLSAEPGLSLFPDRAAARRHTLEEVLAKVEGKLGEKVTRATLLEEPEREVTKRGERLR